MANHVTHDIDLRFESMCRLLRVLVPQRFSFLPLAHDELRLPSLKVLVVTLIEVVLLGHDLASVRDGWVECIRIDALGRLVLHGAHAHLRLHVPFDPG